MPDQSLQIGIIGIGLYATAAHVPQLRQTGRAEVVAISRRSADKLAFSQQQLGVVAGYTDWRALLDHPKLDAVVVSTPHLLHAEQGIAALERGLHVLMEKPLALTLDDATQMVHAAEQAKRVLMVGYNRRFSGLWRTVKQLIVEGGIGQLRQVTMQYALYRRSYWVGGTDPATHAMLKAITGWPDEFLTDLEQGQDWHASAAESGGGMFSNSGSHLVDLILWLAGSYPVKVAALKDNAGMPAECFLSIQALLANGVQVTVSSADVKPGGFSGQGTLALIGEEGVITLDFARPNEIWWTRDGNREQIVARYPDSNAAAAFVSMIMDGDENLAPPREGAYVVAFTEAVYHAAAREQIVTVQYGL